MLEKKSDKTQMKNTNIKKIHKNEPASKDCVPLLTWLKPINIKTCEQHKLDPNLRWGALFVCIIEEVELDDLNLKL